MTADDTWVVSVTIRMEPNRAVIMFDSHVPRAAQLPCSSYLNQMRGLRSDPDQFMVDCNDSRQEFRMNTTLIYNQELDVPAWFEGHRRSRAAAWHRLNGSG